MPELRWILTAVGIIVIVGVYLWSRRQRDDEDEAAGRREPRLGEREPWDAPESLVAQPDASLDTPPRQRRATAETSLEEPVEEPQDSDQLIVALRLRARQPEGFDGSDLVKAFSAEGLEFGKFGAFHALDERRRSRFLVASLVEPGSFELEKMHELRCPGVSMFMVLPGPREPLSALDAMFTCARRLGERLDGEVLDDKGNALTMQQAGWLRERVVEFHRRSKLAGETPADKAP